jgi:hypothetical protein
MIMWHGDKIVTQTDRPDIERKILRRHRRFSNIYYGDILFEIIPGNLMRFYNEHWRHCDIFDFSGNKIKLFKSYYLHPIQLAEERAIISQKFDPFEF